MTGVTDVMGITGMTGMKKPELYLYNSLSRTKEKFVPLEASHVRMYVCGPTVYDFAHLGNARAMVVFDVLYRLLKEDYPHVTYVRNITDIDDKIYKASCLQHCHFSEIAHKFDCEFQKDMQSLDVLPPTHQPYATKFIPQIIEFITALMQKGYAYESDGHVLFSVKKFQQYGTLSHKEKEELLSGARIEVASYKQEAGDFVLWKPSSSEMPGWESPWGFGRPGWHIECSAMSRFYLGDQFDIHGGGIDLIFPHHENERAQSCCVTGCEEMAKVWLHNGHLNVNGKKMSKSLGNFLTIRDALRQASPETVRLALLLAHYRQPLNWTDSSLLMAKNILNSWYRNLEKFETNPLLYDVNQRQIFFQQNEEAVKTVVYRFLEPLYNDLNVPAAIGELGKILHDKQQDDVALVAALMGKTYLGCFGSDLKSWFQGGLHAQKNRSLTQEVIEQKIAERNQARKERQFQKADQIRQELLSCGVGLDDTPEGTKWYLAE